MPELPEVTAIADFLDERVGYCEQFSATMALMARSLGIPARVVVGFTQGRSEDGRWVVRGTDAHAWPELWMGSAGWVRFEPTPGASTTTRPTYTVEQGAPYAGPSAAPSTPSRAAGDESDALDRQDDQTGAGAYAPATGPSGWTLALILGLLLVLMTPALVRVVRRMRRFRAAGAGRAEWPVQIGESSGRSRGGGESSGRYRAGGGLVELGAGADRAGRTAVLASTDWAGRCTTARSATVRRRYGSRSPPKGSPHTPTSAPARPAPFRACCPRRALRPRASAPGVRG